MMLFSHQQEPFENHYHLDGIHLLDLKREEETRDRDAVKIIFFKFNKLFSFLFNKYALTRTNYKSVNTFDYYHVENRTLNVAEVTKLLRDHSISQTYMQ